MRDCDSFTVGSVGSAQLNEAHEAHEETQRRGGAEPKRGEIVACGTHLRGLSVSKPERVIERGRQSDLQCRCHSAQVTLQFLVIKSKINKLNNLTI